MQGNPFLGFGRCGNSKIWMIVEFRTARDDKLLLKITQF